MKTLNQCKKAYLLRYNAAVKAQNEADDELDALMAVNSAIPIGDGQPKGSGDGISMPERFAMRAEAVQADLKAAYDRYENTRREVTGAIMALEDESYIAIMRDRYMNFKMTPYEEKRNEAAAHPWQKRQATQLRSWEEIAERNGYVCDTVKHIHGEALERIIVPEEWVRSWTDATAKTIEELD